MKDLYRRCGLANYEINRDKLSNITQGNDDEQHACFSILLNPDRKVAYDNTHRALTAIAKVRQAIDMQSNAGWVKRYGDFAESAEQASSLSASETITPVKMSAFSSGVEKKVTGEKRKNRVLGFFATAATMCIAVLAILFSDDDVSHIASDDMELLLAPELMHVKSLTAAIYPRMVKSDQSVEPIIELEHQVEVNVEKISDDGLWVWISSPSVKGYTLRSNLRPGPSEETIALRCRESGTQRPMTSVISNFFRSGQHVLTLANPPGKDALVKLKNGDGDVQLLVYLRSGEELEVGGVGDGNHQLEYALGENYSPQCGRFVDHMQAFREAKKISYRSTVDSIDSLSNRYVYILKSKVVGLQSISNQAF
ncbi:hypothetical protein NBRC116494_05420 [Aurantivibrio plasticivorans]